MTGHFFHNYSTLGFPSSTYATFMDYGRILLMHTCTLLAADCNVFHVHA